MVDMGILPNYDGVIIHDFWKSYYKYLCDHGLCDTQREVADYMGLDPGTGGGANKDDQLNYYKNGIDKSRSDEYKAKEEIDANRPLKSGVDGHDRCAAGYMKIYYHLYLLINDPWPENIGLIYWELYWGRKHTYDIHVED
jgi:hypothetical protein